jgi:hypothetical protein
MAFAIPDDRCSQVFSGKPRGSLAAPEMKNHRQEGGPRRGKKVKSGRLGHVGGASHKAAMPRAFQV